MEDVSAPRKQSFLGRGCAAYTAKSKKLYGSKLPTAFQIQLCTYLGKRKIGRHRYLDYQTRIKRPPSPTLGWWKRKVKQKGHRADALALRAEERRDKLRKASGRSKYPSIRRSLNGETRLRKPQSSMRQSITHGREPGELKHLSTRRKRKKTRFPQ